MNTHMLTSFTLSAAIAAILLATAACETLPPGQRPTRAIQSPQNSNERELIGSDNPGFTLFSLEGPRDKTDSVHVHPFGGDKDLIPSTAPAATQPLVPLPEEPHGSINLVPQGNRPTTRP